MATVPIPRGATIDAETAQMSRGIPIPQGATIDQAPEDQASQTRQMLVSGLTGMPTPNMTPEQRDEFQRGKAAGAVSVPLVAGATIGASAAPQATAAIAAMAKAHPEAAQYLVKRMMDAVGLAGGVKLYHILFGDSK